MSKKTQSQPIQSAPAAAPPPAKTAPVVSASAPIPTRFIVRKGGKYPTRYGAYAVVKPEQVIHLHAYGADEVERMRLSGIQLDPLP